MKLTNEEQETIIIINPTEKDALVTTWDKKLQRQIKEMGITPIWENKDGEKEYKIPKNRIKITKPRKLSAKQRKELGQRLSKARAKKSPNSVKNNVIT